MTAIPASEFAGRRAKAARAARGRGFRGLLVCARGGGTADRYGDVMYLTNFYTAFPFIPDRPPDWSARAHAFVLLPADGPEALVADMGVAPDWQVPIDDIVVAADMIEALSRELAARGMGECEVGIAGADALPWSAHQALRRNLPDVRWTDASDILERLRLVKSAGEIALLRRSSEIGSRVTDAMIEAARPGVTHGEVMLAGLEVLVPRGGLLYNAFMSSGRGGANAAAVSSAFPTYGAGEPLSDGQWFHVGLSGVLGGYYFDHARSVSIGDPTPAQIEAYEAPIAAVQAGMAAIRPGARASDVAVAGRRALEQRGFALEGRFQGFGHGIGLGWDSPWLVPDDGTPLEPGMVLCVERSVRHDGLLRRFRGDRPSHRGWLRAADRRGDPPLVRPGRYRPGGERTAAAFTAQRYDGKRPRPSRRVRRRVDLATIPFEPKPIWETPVAY